MSKLLRTLMIATVLTTAALSLACSSATASHFLYAANEVMPSEGNITLTTRNERGETITLIECPITLSATFVNGTFEEGERQTAGTLTASRVGRCALGGLVWLSATTFVVNFELSTIGMGDEGVYGVLATAANTEFLIEDANYRCLYRGVLNFLIGLTWRPAFMYWNENVWIFLPFTPTGVTTLPGSPLTCRSGTFNWDGQYQGAPGRIWRR